jgi:hypothetical protein
VLGDANDEEEELLRERDAATHAGVGEEGEDGEDCEDDGTGPVLDDPEVDGICGEREKSRESVI